jgi:hypothetical protein
VALLRTDVSEEPCASIIGVTRINVVRFLVTANLVAIWLILFILLMEVISSSEPSGLSRATLRHISDDGVLHIDISLLKQYTTYIPVESEPATLSDISDCFNKAKDDGRAKQKKPSFLIKILL